jgi:hypothetical protein
VSEPPHKPGLIGGMYTASEQAELARQARVEAELLASMYSGPAAFANRLHVVQIGSALRIAVAEQWNPEVAPSFRGAVMMEIAQARELARIITEVADRAEGSRFPHLSPLPSMTGNSLKPRG